MPGRQTARDVQFLAPVAGALVVLGGLARLLLAGPAFLLRLLARLLLRLAARLFLGLALRRLLGRAALALLALAALLLPRFQLAATVAQYAELLRGSPWAQGTSLQQVGGHATRLAELLPGDSDVREFTDLVWRAGQLQGF